jgi:hypothetical protein
MKVVNLLEKLNVPWYVSIGNMLLWVTRWQLVFNYKKDLWVFYSDKSKRVDNWYIG